MFGIDYVNYTLLLLKKRHKEVCNKCIVIGFPLLWPSCTVTWLSENECWKQGVCVCLARVAWILARLCVPMRKCMLIGKVKVYSLPS